MAETFKLPAIGDTMVEGEVVEWFVAVGDEVALDQPICSMETDKTVVELTTPFGGVVLSLGGQPGESISVGDPLIIIGQQGEQPVDLAQPDRSVGEPEEPMPARRGGTDDTEASAGSVISPVVRKLAASFHIDLATVAGTGPGGRITRADVQALVEATDGSPAEPRDQPLESGGASAGASGTVLAMPKIRRLAREQGIDIQDLTGTGPRGSITVADLPPSVTSTDTRAETRTDTSAAPRPDGEPRERTGRRERLSATRRSIAAHLTRSVREIPQFTSMIEVDAGALLATRSALSERSGTKLPMDGLLMALLIPVLRRHPIMNAELDGDEIAYFDHYDIGVAVDTADGLMVPVVRAADDRSITEIGSEIRRLAEAARDRTVQPSDLSGATCTINNVGALGVLAGTPILPLGTSAIIAFGLTRPTLQLRNGALAEIQTMTISATFDHRLVDGGGSGRFLADLKQHLEVPALGLSGS